MRGSQEFLIWDIAGTLRAPIALPGTARHAPVTVLRRLHCVLAATRPQVLATRKKWSHLRHRRLNDRFGTNFIATGELFWQQVRDDALANQNLQQAGAANTRHDFAYAPYQHLEELVVNRMDRNGAEAGTFFENPEVRSVIQNWMLDPIRFS